MAKAVLNTQGNHIIYDGTDTSKYVVVRNAEGLAMGNGFFGAAANLWRLELAETIRPGDFVKARQGKFVKWRKTVDESDEIAGQILAVDNNVVGKSYLDRVDTAYKRAVTPQARMPGFATRGVPYSVHLVTDGAQAQFSAKKKLDGTALATAGMSTPTL